MHGSFSSMFYVLLYRERCPTNTRQQEATAMGACGGDRQNHSGDLLSEYIEKKTKVDRRERTRFIFQCAARNCPHESGGVYHLSPRRLGRHVQTQGGRRSSHIVRRSIWAQDALAGLPSSSISDPVHYRREGAACIIDRASPGSGD